MLHCVSPVPAPSVQRPPPSPSLPPALSLGFLTPTPLHSFSRGPGWKGAPSPPGKAGGGRACGRGPWVTCCVCGHRCDHRGVSVCVCVCVCVCHSCDLPAQAPSSRGSAILPVPQWAGEQVSAGPPGVATGASALRRLMHVVAGVGGSVLVHGESQGLAGDRWQPPHPLGTGTGRDPPQPKERGRE